MSPSVILRLVGFGVVVLAAPGVPGAQAITAPSGWVKAPEPGATETSAFATVANPGMYEVYIIGVASEASEAAELRQLSAGAAKPTPIKEITVPAYDRLEMAANGVHIQLLRLKQPLKTGDAVPLFITLDNGTTLRVEAVVK